MIDKSLYPVSKDPCHQNTVTSGEYRPPFKYNEAAILEELHTYVLNTYGQHYVSKDNIQSLDLIFSSDHGIGFCVGNVLKYAARYGKKKGEERKDIWKIIHYAMLLLYLHDQK